MSKLEMTLSIIFGLAVAGGAAAIYLFDLSVNTLLIGLLVLLCPLSHFLMMRFMGHDHGNSARKPQHDGPQELNKDASNG